MFCFINFRFALIVFSTYFMYITVGTTVSLVTIQEGQNFDNMITSTSTSLMPVTPPCFECTTLTAQPPNKICSDLVVTFKYACTDNPCHTTNPCTTPKSGCKKNKPKKPCCIKHMEEEYRKRKLKTSKKNKKNKTMEKYGFIKS